MDRTTRTRFQPVVGPLDPRCLMAAHLTASLARGVLTVRGTAAADVIVIDIQPPGSGNRTGTVAIDGVSRTFKATQVKRIEVVAGAGDDVVTIHDQGRVATPFRVQGGPGRNIINGVPDSPGASAVASVPGPAPVLTPVVSSTVPVFAPVAPVVAPVPSQPVASTPVAPTPVAPVVSLSAIEQRIFDLTNAERLKAGLTALTISAPLTQAAVIQSGNMARLGLMAHELPGTAQPTLTDRAAAVGYSFARLGENIAFRYSGADAVVAGWMASPGHRANILDPSFTEFGVSVALDSTGQPYLTQVFGRSA